MRSLLFVLMIVPLLAAPAAAPLAGEKTLVVRVEVVEPCVARSKGILDFDCLVRAGRAAAASPKRLRPWRVEHVRERRSGVQRRYLIF